jgi:hypothetical protein
MQRGGSFPVFKDSSNPRRSAMRTVFVLLVASLAVVSIPLFSDSITDPELETFVAGETASASDVNSNFDVVQAAVNDNDSRITTLEGDVIRGVTAGSGLTGGGSSGNVTVSVGTGTITATHLGTNSVGADEIAANAVGTSEIADNSVTSADIANGTITGTDIASSTIYDTNIGDEPGIEYTSNGGGATIGSTSASLGSMQLTTPTSGYVLVIASGSVYWSIASAAQGMCRLRISTAAGDTGEGEGVQFIRFQSGLGTGTFSFPFSILRVYSVAASTYTFYLNAVHQVVNGTLKSDDWTMSAIFIPTRY